MDDFEVSSSRPAVHWWYDSKEAGVRNIPPSSEWRAEARKASITQIAATPETSATVFPTGTQFQQPRRDSLRNLIHLCDFATP